MVAGRLEIELMAELGRLRKDLGDAKALVGGTMGEVEKIMKTAALSIGAAFTAAISAISFDKIIDAAHEAEKATLRLDAVIKATGSSAGFTREQLDHMADSMANATQFDDEAFRTAAAHIIRFGNVAGEQFERTLKVSADLAAFLGTDLVGATDIVAKAMAAPAQGIERLQRTIGYLDEAQIKSIKTMVELGDVAGAQNEILKVMEGRIGGVAEALNTGYTKAIEDAKKQTQEFFEAIGKTSAVQGATTSFLTFVAASFRDLKAMIEDGDWVEKGLRLLAFAGGWRGSGNPTSGGGAGDGGAAARAAADQQEADRVKAIRAGIDEQDAKLLKGAIERNKKAAEERLRNAEFVARAELAAEEMAAKDKAEAWSYVTKQILEDDKATAKEREFIAKQVAEGEADAAKITQDAWSFVTKYRIEEQKNAAREFHETWGQALDVFAQFTADLVLNGKSAFDSLRKFAKQLLAEMIAIFAKRWVLQLAGVAGGTTYGANTMAGGVMDAGINAVTGGSGLWSAGGTLAAGYGSFVAGAQGATLAAGVAGPTTAGAGGLTGLGASMAPVYEALAAIPVWGWIAIAVIAIGAWIAGSHKGGDKVGGSFFSGGDVPGTDNGRFFTPDQGDPMVRDIVNATIDSYANISGRLGGSGSFNFGLGFDHDPSGTQQSRVSSMLTNAQGEIVYRRDNAGMDDKEVPAALALETQRMLVRALQETDLGPAINALLDPFNVTIASSEQLQAILAQALEMKAIIDTLALWDVGLTVESIQMMVREGETLGQTFNSVAAAMQQYYQLFFTEEEQHAMGMAQLTKQFKDLGVELPTTREGFRALVEGIDKTTEEGARLWRRLIELAPAFADLVPAIEDVDDAVDDLGTTAVAVVQTFGRMMSDGTLRPLSDDLLNAGIGSAGARGNLGGYLNNLATGQSAPVGMDQRLREAVRQYEETLKLAQGGDVGAIGRLSSVHSTALNLYRQTYGSGSQTVDFYNRTFDQMAAIANVPGLQERTAKATEALLAKVSQSADSLAAMQQDQRTATDMIVSAVNSSAERVARAVEATPLGQR